jgi:tetratricopeptide (TPR) repeat protein
LSSAGKKKRQKKRAQEVPLAGAEPFYVSRYSTLVLSLLLAAVTLAVYFSVVKHSFINYDDDKYIGLPQLQQPFNWKLIHWAFTSFVLANWHPLTLLSHALDYQLFQSSSAAVHLENVFFHIASAMLLFCTLQNATGRTWRSLLVAALFALHPVNVESVAWAAERKNVLSMLFFVLTLLAYQWYVRHRTISRYLLVFAAFGLGLLAKPQIVTLPFVLPLWDIWPLGRWPNNHAESPPSKSLLGLMLEKIPLVLLAGMSAIMTIRAQAGAGAVGNLTVYPFSLRVENALVEYVQYLFNLLWPSRLAVLYPYPSSIPAWQVVGSLLILLGITATVLVSRKRPYLVVGWFWYLGTLVPMIGLVQVGVAARADRYLYLPSIGIFLLVVWAITDWADERSVSKVIAGAAAAIVLGLLAIISWRQIGYWRDSETLWKHTLQVTSGNAIAEANLGTALFSLGRSDEAFKHFHRAVAIDHGDFLGQLYLGINEGQHGNAQGAIEHFQIALQRPGQADMVEMAYSNLGNAYRNLHDYTRARENFEIALEMNSTDSGAAIGMGLIAQHDKNLADAIRWYSRATVARPNSVASLLMAKAMERNGQKAESKEAYQQAQRYSRDMNATQRVVEKMLTTVD